MEGDPIAQIFEGLGYVMIERSLKMVKALTEI